MIDYRSDKNFIYLNKTPFELKNHVKEILNGVYLKGKGYRFPKNVHVYRELFKFFPAIRNNAQFVEDGKIAGDAQKYWESKKDSDAVMNFGLREYQNADATYLVNRGSSLVLNEPRTGKTPTMIKVLESLAPKTTLIVTPSSLTYNWSKEIEKWSNTLVPYVYSGTPKQREKTMKQYKNSTGYKVLIVSKDTLKRDKDLQDMVFTAMVVDEAHFLRNWKTAQSQAINKVTATYKYALTGTPAVKHGVDVYGLLHFINPNAFPSYWQFADRYFDIQEDQWGKSIGKVKTNREEELKALMQVNSVQRKRKDVMEWLPAAQYEQLLVQMEGKQLKYYDQMVNEMMVEGETDDEGVVDTMNVLNQILRLRQLCLDPRLIGLDAPSAKTKALLEFAENNDDPFIVMTTFSSYFKLIKPELEKLGKKVGIIDGSIDQKKKFTVAETFQKGSYDILLCNIIAAGTGFTLDRADTVIFLDKDFNPANNEQAQDRIVPTTESRYHPINIISLVADGSIDKRVDDILSEKLDLTKIINNPKSILEGVK